jgi:hypothetical protein
VVTSPDGAALHDIVAVTRRRWPAAELIVVAAKVQGDGAAAELCAAIARAGRWRDGDGRGFDVVIVDAAAARARTSGRSTTRGSPGPWRPVRCPWSRRSATRST